ncbi:hypothetical protein ACGF7U_31470 [Micromonospora sp. NPDC047670]|uniref:hypothetical protein n=1 Tax=Micromonospora sp. NPDC047670 TaxID=3364252 RepID=UPI0037162D33
METGVVVALVSAAGVIGAGLTGTVVAHVLGRQTRAAQQRLAAAQTKQAEAAAVQLQAEGDRIRQDIYQELTTDLRTELQSVKSDLNGTLTALRDARQSLARTSAEAERLRRRVVELESRIAQLELTEQHLSAELRAVQAERDQLRIQLAGKEATITALTSQIGDLKTQLAGLQQAPAQSAVS